MRFRFLKTLEELETCDHMFACRVVYFVENFATGIGLRGIIVVIFDFKLFLV